jgi:phenolic acid decarboxylase
MITLEGVSKSDRVIVYDIAGRLMSTVEVKGEDLQAVDLANLSAGLYTIGVYSATGTRVAHIGIMKN